MKAELTIYEKFLAIPKQVKVQKKHYLGVTTIEYDFDILFDSKYNDACCICYDRTDGFGNYELLDNLQWFGTFEECVEQAYNYFCANGKLLEE